ncbi:hypothetical protein HanRHA438_Chr06g0278941 [Helianthus annuus]|uniref:Uncharacterized protein n=1 Tax=Helianthus annuus TaxID=4232 RepID=A0A251TDW2_HELAN|nr:hypothetical protein HanXRQr2_Chr06g0269711 [Helianthus annuus]KAJ0567895.1 hypothetical protein HanIR_Chr06g0290011 [Helianthus annuus]KAJ0574340.1 hypothetical protein HanHA89_Chr06g0237011 [Helianthus annuus]KAJ0738676.1 hypothetical protein HanLR1_Chr06g0220951 [Helianthus annuus]KAJ0741562.1 hypothetical protein HanOQP8_Chr06g0229431 [Helianthus annuus]
MLKKFVLMVHTTCLINCFREHMKNNSAVVTKTPWSNHLFVNGIVSGILLY